MKSKKPITGIKRPNPNTRHAVEQTRLNMAEHKILIDKATVYHQGDRAKFIREAILNYRPLNRKAVG